MKSSSREVIRSLVGFNPDQDLRMELGGKAYVLDADSIRQEDGFVMMDLVEVKDEAPRIEEPVKEEAPAAPVEEEAAPAREATVEEPVAGETLEEEAKVVGKNRKASDK